MPRNGITHKQVVEAAEYLLSQGLPVTVTAVRAHLGGTGSYTTISNHLKAWREEIGTESPVPKDLERSVSDLLGRLWRGLVGVGAEARQRNEERMHDLAGEVQHCLTDLRRLRAEQDESERRMELLQTEIAQTERLLTDMAGEIAAIHREQRSLQLHEEALARRLDALESAEA